MKNLLTLISFVFLTFNVNGQAALSGKVTDADTGEPILFGDVVVYQNGELITGEQTDFDGNYVISPIDTGIYEIVFLYVGYAELKIKNVLIENNKEKELDASIKLGKSNNSLEVTNCPIPMIRQDEFEKGHIFKSRDIQRMPNKN